MNTLLRRGIPLTLALTCCLQATAGLAQSLPPGGGSFGQPPAGGLPPGGDEYGGYSPPAPDSEIPEACRPAPGEIPDPFCMAPPPEGEGGSGGFPDFPVGGFDPDDFDPDDFDFDDYDVDEFLTQFDPSLFASFGVDDLQRLSPELTKGLDASYIGNLKPDVVASLAPDFLLSLTPSVFAGFTPEQVAQLTGSQWATLGHQQLESLSPSAIQSMGSEAVKQLNAAEFQAMSPEDISKMMVNFTPGLVSAKEVAGLLPEGWVIDDTSGRLSPPPGATVSLRTLEIEVPETLRLPPLPNLDTGLALGGNAAGGTVLTGLTRALASAVGDDFRFEQEDGILTVRSGPGAEIAAAFIPDSKAMKQAQPGSPPGVSLDDSGKYVLTTPDGLQVPVIPSLQNPESLLNAVAGMAIRIEEAGDTRIDIPGQNPLMGIPDPFVQSSALPAGIHRSGEGPDQQVTVVFPDGRAQKLNPMIQDRENFVSTVSAIPQISGVQIQMDGTILVDYQGQTLRLRPAFDISPGSGSGGQAGITLTGPDTAEFINAKGDRQVFYIR